MALTREVSWGKRLSDLYWRVDDFVSGLVRGTLKATGFLLLGLIMVFIVLGIIGLLWFGIKNLELG